MTYTVQMCESLMGLMLLLTLYCAVRAVDVENRLWWQVGAVLACGMSMGSKQTAVVAPLLVLLHDHIFIAKPWSERYRPRFYVALLVPVALSILTVISGVRQVVGLQKTIAYALAQPGVVLHYLKLSLWPRDLYLYVNTRLFAVDSAAEVLWPALVLLFLLAATLLGIVKRRWFGFLGGWFFLTLAPTSSLFAINDRIQEHRMYVPLAALAVLAVMGADGALRVVFNGRLSGRGQIIVRLGLLIVVLVGLGARTYMRNGDYHNEFTMIHPADLSEAYMIQAQHHLKLDNLDDAAGEARKLLARSSGEPTDIVFAHFVSGFAAERRGDPEAAVTHFRQAAELQSDFVYARRALAANLMRLDRLEEAQREIELALETRPQFPEAHYECGLILARRHQTARAVEHFERAVALQPDFAEAHYELGMALHARGDAGGAQRHLHQAIEAQADFAEPHYGLGILLRAGNARAAAKHFEEAIRLRPEFAEAHYEVGSLWYDQGDLDRAIREFQEAARLKPDLIEAHEELAAARREQNKRQTSARYLRRTLAIDPGSASEDELSTAIENLLEAIRIDPEAINAYLEAALALKEEGDAVAAELHLRLALRARPDFAEAHYEIGILRRDQDDLEGAVQHLLEAVRVDPKFAQAHYDLGQLLVEQGDPTGGAAHLRRAAAIDPEFAENGDSPERTTEPVR